MGGNLNPGSYDLPLIVCKKRFRWFDDYNKLTGAAIHMAFQINIHLMQFIV